MLRNARSISWLRGARKDFEDCPLAAQIEMARALTIWAEGRMPDIAKPLTGFGSGGMALALKHRGDAFPATDGDVEMNDDMEMVRGTGNVFREPGHPDADREQLRALLAARIIGLLGDRKLTVRAAQEITGVAAADFSRIRMANLGRFTIDRLMTILICPRARGGGDGQCSPT